MRIKEFKSTQINSIIAKIEIKVQEPPKAATLSASLWA
jgi:hypothetical protein